MDSLVGPCRKYYAGLSTNGQQIGNVTFFASLGSKQDTTTGILPRCLPIDKIEHVKESCRGRQEDVISGIPGENWARIGPPVRITPESHHFCLLDDEAKIVFQDHLLQLFVFSLHSPSLLSHPSSIL